MDLIIISGRSGSGKSTALHQLEDEGFYAIDNLPASLLPALVRETGPGLPEQFRGIAVCIDARNAFRDLQGFNAALASLPESVQPRILYLDADEATLIKRFSETRRRHPLTNQKLPLAEAIRYESELLEPLAAQATLTLDTRTMTIYELRDAIRQRLVGSEAEEMAILFQSFGFKRGVPGDADLIFDLRLLPNPHWSTELRRKTGEDPDVVAYLEDHDITGQLFQDIAGFIERWVPAYQKSSRSYLTVALGCTGGQHRSVYMARRLYNHFQGQLAQLQLRHRELQ
ncbi:RNase adapter RapZ [Congregibacter litoralis]|uniref:Putative P-loop-containing kinase n=1 Tax=Congregibacter litoralis KT71 TaxID=314285 RepID=A4A5C1_9GAMM|nr:RNase adapter RapZ [Congregibacter litoralis]EAQ98992.1 putative P-loop-containing kinase [Congregibacter litoralis KT71]